MSDELDALAESARNRGLKLVRSRIRTPGRAGFGKVGLTDAKGTPVFAVEGKLPTADPSEVERYLRGLGLSDWSASLGVPEPKRRPKQARLSEKPAPSVPERLKPTMPKTPAEPAPEPEVAIREAKPADAAALVALMGLLDHHADEAGVRKRMKQLAEADEATLVATLGDVVVGLCGIHRMTTIHRADPVGRITILAVAEDARGEGIGRKLVERAEEVLRAAGCALLEITCNDRLTRAHAFYRHIGYERTGMRFARSLRS